MANTPSEIDFATETLAAFLAKAVSDGTFDDVVTTLKIDNPGEEAAATQIQLAAGQIWSNVVDDFIKATYPKQYKSIKLWSAADGATRDALGSDDNLAVDDIAWVKDVKQFFYVVSVDGVGSSTWANATGGGGGGSDGGFRFNYDAGTGDSDPGAGNYRLNNADPDLATLAFVDDQTLNGVGLNDLITNYAIGDQIFFQQEDSIGNSKLFDITGPIVIAAGYFKIPISLGSAAQGADMATGTVSQVFLFSLAGSLSQVLAKANTTLGNNIVMTTADAIVGDPVIIRTNTTDAFPVLQLETTVGNGETIAIHTGNTQPNGNITGNPGDLYILKDDSGSTMFQHHGDNPSNDDWAEFASGTGSSLSGEWRFDSSTSMTAPANGRIRFNNATQGSATQIAISAQTDTGVDAHGILVNVIDAGWEFYIQDKTDSAQFHVVNITGAPVDNTTWIQYAVTVTASGVSLDNNDRCIVIFSTDTGGGTPNLATVLAAGNGTGGNDIVFENSGADGISSTGGFPIKVKSTSADSTPVLQLNVTGSAGADTNFHSGDRNPNGVATGNPGAMYFRANGVNSQLFQVRTASASNTWAEIGAANLAATLALGNETVGNDILIDTGDAIVANPAGPVDIRSSGADTVAVAALESTGSAGAKVPIHSGDRNPDGLVTAVPGSFYFRTNGVNSRIYQQRQAASSSVWTEISADGGAADLPVIQVSRTADRTLAGAPSTIPFDSIDLTTGTGDFTFTASDTEIVVVEKARYWVVCEASVTSTDSTSARIELNMYLNGVAMSTPEVFSVSAVDGTSNAYKTQITCSFMRELAALDDIGPRIWLTSGSGAVGDQDTMRLMITKVSPTLV